MFTLRTLGGVSVELDGAVQDAFGTQRKTLALLTLLAVSRGKGISRDRIATYLWPQSDMERSRGALKQALHVVRRLLPREAILGTSELRLNPQQIRSDVDEFLCALGGGDLQRAVDRYGGPFLDGFYLRGSIDFEQWAATQRDDLARRYMAALEQLAGAAVARGDQAEAVGFWRRIQAEDPLNSRITVELMTCQSEQILGGLTALRLILSGARLESHLNYLPTELPRPYASPLPIRLVDCRDVRLCGNASRGWQLRSRQRHGGAALRRHRCSR
jgi:DNA-binding SARP family transcriptional activator